MCAKEKYRREGHTKNTPPNHKKKQSPGAKLVGYEGKTYLHIKKRGGNHTRP